jgi:repressor LexA
VADITGLPKGQRRAYEIIRDAANNGDLPPTLEELAKRLGNTSKGNAKRIVDELETKGLITLLRSAEGRLKSRSVRPASKDPGPAGDEQTVLQLADDPAHDKGRSVIWEGRIDLDDSSAGILPMVGEVAAGGTKYAEENLNENVSLASLFKGRNLYLLLVTGDSMIGDHIAIGDYVIVDRDAQCVDGEMVVAYINGEATLKRYWREGQSVCLESSNPRYKVIKIDQTDYSALLGKVVGVIRNHIPYGSRMSRRI